MRVRHVPCEESVGRRTDGGAQLPALQRLSRIGEWDWGPSSLADHRARPHSSCVCVLQAEDGIRDESVTGVQTCALPINSSHTLISYAVFCLRDESVTGV